jgi:hypothetical protein
MCLVEISFQSADTEGHSVYCVFYREPLNTRRTANSSSFWKDQLAINNLHSSVLEERVNHDIALSSERDEVDRKKRHAADTTHFLFEKYSLD